MNVVKSFHAARTTQAAQHRDELLPTILARAAAHVLSIDAVAITLTGHQHRIPIGASSPQAAAAEQWQFTTGEGPCRSAYTSNQPVIADQEELHRRWPTLHEKLRQHTLVRSVVALPLGLGFQCIGVLELYAFTPQPAADFDLPDAVAVAATIHTMLMEAGRTDRLDPEPRALWISDLEADRAAADPVWTDPAEPAWLTTDAVLRRHNVWRAIGMLLAVETTATFIALSLLRARAYALGQTLDDLADDLITGRVPVRELIDS